MAKRRRKKKRPQTKERSQESHAKRRFVQRFGIILTKELKERIVKMIQEGYVQIVEKQSNRISLFDVPVEGKMIRIVYDRTRKNIVTALYPELDDERLKAQKGNET